MSDVFISQRTLDEWHEQERIELEGDRMRTPAVEVDFWCVEPAVYFDAVDGDCEDKYNLIGVVKTAQQLAQIRAEHYLTSVVFEEAAYTVIPGFLISARNRADQEIELTQHICQQLIQMASVESESSHVSTTEGVEVV